MLPSTSSLATTLHYHFILLSLLWANPSYYFPSDLLEATERCRDYSVSRGGAITYRKQWCFSCRAFQLQKHEISMVITFLVMRLPSSSVNCSSVTDSPGMVLASSPYRMWQRDERGECGWVSIQVHSTPHGIPHRLWNCREVTDCISLSRERED